MLCVFTPIPIGHICGRVPWTPATQPPWPQPRATALRPCEAPGPPAGASLGVWCGDTTWAPPAGPRSSCKRRSQRLAGAPAAGTHSHSANTSENHSTPLHSSARGTQGSGPPRPGGCQRHSIHKIPLRPLASTAAAAAALSSAMVWSAVALWADMAAAGIALPGRRMACSSFSEVGARSHIRRSLGPVPTRRGP